MKKFFSFAILLLVANLLLTATHAQCPNPGGPESDFGDDVWKVNVYALGVSYDTSISWLPELYTGYYIDSSLNFDSQDKWSANSDPTTAPSYHGCEIYSQDYISWSAKRQGFPCGIYRVDITNHDDYADLFIDGVRVWGEESANSNIVVNAWTGPLNSRSTLEFRIAEDENLTNGALSFTYLGSTGSFIDVTGHSLVCTGQSYTLTSTLTGASYAWSNGETTNPAHGSETGSYFVTVTDDDGCSLTSDPVNISVLPDAAPVAHITASSNSTCNWEMITLSSDSTSGNTWSTTANTQNISMNIPGEYVLTVTNNAGCFDQATAAITGGFTPPAPIVAENVSGCQTVTLAANGLAPGGKTASFDNVWVEVVQDIPESDFTIEMWVKTTEAKTAFFTARKLIGPGPEFDRDLYLDNGQLQVHISSGHILNSGITINDGKWHHIALTVQTGAGTKLYVDGGLAPNTDPYDHSDINQDRFYLGFSLLAHLESNDYFSGEMDNVRIWSEARSEQDIRTNMALETPLSSINLIYHCTLNGSINPQVGNNGFVFTGFGPLNFPSAQYYTYTWTGEGAPVASTNELQTTSALSTGGNYTVTASAGSCTVSSIASTTVTVIPATSYYPDADSDTYGSSSASPLLSCTDPGAGYVTSHSDCNDGNAAVNPVAVDICNGIDDNCNGQTDENAITATVNPGGTVNACKGTGFTLTANSGSGLTYQWLKSNNNISGATNQSYLPAKTGVYSVKETNSFGCSSTSSITSVTIVTKPVAQIVAMGNLNICGTGSVILQANSGPGYTYQWMKGSAVISGATNQSYTATKKGTYKVEVTNSTSCSKTSNSLMVTKSCRMGDENDEEDVILADLNVYPNPASERFMIDLKMQNTEDETYKLDVMNMLGQMVYSESGSMTDSDLKKEISLSPETATGIYMVRVTTNGHAYQTDLVIQH